MLKNSQFCQIAGHDMYQITQICTQRQCQLDSRLMCEGCIRNQIHIHEGHENFMKLDDFDIYLETIVKAKIEQQKKEAKRVTQFVYQINQIISQLQHIVEQQENYITHQKEIVKTYKKANKKLLTLKNQQLNYFINFEDQILDYFQTQNDLQKIRTQLQDLCQQCFAANYQTHNIISIQNITQPSLSYNEKYLCFVVDSSFLRINKLKSNQKILNKKLNVPIVQAKFSLNSQFLFTSDDMGKFRQISIKNNFKQIFRRSINIHNISDHIELDNNQLVISYRFIRIYDYMKRRLILTINNDSFVYCLEFDRINNLIVACFENKTIKFYDRNTGNMVILKSFGNKKKVHQIQLINKSQSLLGCDKYSLKVWSIDYQNKKLALIKQFNQSVFYFKSVYQDKRIIIRNKTQLIVIDNNLNIIYEKSITGQYFNVNYKFDQLQSMNYILFKEKKGALKILKNINKE